MAQPKTTNPITLLMRAHGTSEAGKTSITTPLGRLFVNGLNYEYLPVDGSQKRVAPGGINDSAKSAVLLRAICREDPYIEDMAKPKVTT